VEREPAGSGGQAFVAWERPDQILDVQQWLGRLEEPYRTAVELSLQGCSRREVADQMGVADATVRKWMQRLRERHGEELGA
jgi:DNA-directed RNA polymerase specialized sigma24 family protein